MPKCRMAWDMPMQEQNPTVYSSMLTLTDRQTVIVMVSLLITPMPQYRDMYLQPELYAKFLQ